MATEPLYLRPASWVREQVREGNLAPGAAVPTERDLAEKFQVSRATAARALEVLVNEGLITQGYSRAGRTVRDRRILPIHASQSEAMDHRRTAGIDAWVSDVRAHGREPDQSIDVGVVPADSRVAQWLDVEEGRPVAVRRRLRTVDGMASNRADTYYPMELAQEIPEILDPSDVPQGVIALMAERGYVQVRYVDRLEWRPPTPEEARELGIGAGTSVLIQWRTGYTDENLAVKLTRTLWPGDTVQLVYELPA